MKKQYNTPEAKIEELYVVDTTNADDDEVFPFDPSNLDYAE